MLQNQHVLLLFYSFSYVVFVEFSVVVYAPIHSVLQEHLGF